MKRTITYQEFLVLCSDTISAMYPGEFETELCSTLRNNDVAITGLLLRQKGERVAPNFYLMHQYEAWLEDKITPAEIVTEIYQAYQEEIEKNRSLVRQLNFTWEEFKGHVFMRLISRERNKELLHNSPYEEYLDMAVAYYYVLTLDEETQGVMAITNDHLTLLGVTKEELREAARENTFRQYQPKITGMSELIRHLADRLGIRLPIQYTWNSMFVLSNERGSYGAVAMMATDVLERFSGEIGGSFFILPSSVHEVILVPDAGEISAEIFSHMVRDVNATKIAECDILTDSVYYYDREIHTVRRVA